MGIDVTISSEQCHPHCSWHEVKQLMDYLYLYRRTTAESRAKIWQVNWFKLTRWLRLLSILRWWFCCWFIVYCFSHWLCFIVCAVSLFCCTVFASCLILQSSRWEREGWLLYFGCYLVGVLCLFLTMPWFGLQYLIVAFPGHTHFLV